MRCLMLLWNLIMKVRNTSPYSRVRRENGIVRSTVPSWATQIRTTTVPGQLVSTVLGSALSAYRGESRYCSDVVTPNFREIVDQGGIVNNPFVSVTCKCDHGGVGQQSWSTVPWVPDATWSMDVKSILRNDPRYLFPDVIPVGNDDPFWGNLLTDIDWRYLQRTAKTSALSKVDQNLASGLVGLGELRATLSSLLNPFSSIRKYFTGWMNGVSKRVGKAKYAKQVPYVIANEYLAFYYGILPFCRDIESYLDAYIKSGAQHERITARGGAKDTKALASEILGTPVAGLSHYNHRFTSDISVEVKSGVLYMPSPLTWQKVYGIRYSDFFDAAYQLTPWSFFVDYFSNLGKLVNALTPRAGVTYLASWSSLLYTKTERAECTGGGVGSNYVWIRQNTEWAERVTKVRVRLPESVYSNVGLVLKRGNWDSYAKIGAVISLLTQAVWPKI